MKYLISLSFKYIRRQKLRSFLTFMCIMLSAFILATVCVYGSSLFTTLYNYTVEEDGLWELEISGWIDSNNSLDIAKHHAVVSDYYSYISERIRLDNSNEGNASFRQHLFEVSNGKQSFNVKTLNAITQDGNPNLENSYNRSNHIPSDDSVLAPYSLKNMGYEIGDTVTLTITPVSAIFDENSDVMKEIRAELKEKNGTELTPTDKEYEYLPTDLKKKSRKASIVSKLNSKGIDFNDYPLTDKQYGVPIEISFKIGGFINEYSKPYFEIQSNANSNVSFIELERNNPNINIEGNSVLLIRLIDNFDYDKALEMLFTDLGHNYETEFYSFESQIATNTLLLALELKSPYAIYQILFTIIIPALLVLLIAWFISRFVIDNTFEMAVKERSTHFAALRIIGASKLQIAALVFAEALFYCFTAVPPGIISAILLCKGAFTALRKSGLDMFEFSAKPFFIIIAAFLVIIAIFISAYTSAMWAARKLSPAEALNFGKPRRKKHSKRTAKSKLNLNSKKFIRRYTRKNIKVGKGRFAISTITMGLGVLMFTLTSLIMMKEYNEYKKHSKNSDIIDFQIIYYSSYDTGDPAENLDKYFGDTGVFSKYTVIGEARCQLNPADGSEKIAVEKLSINKNRKSQPISLLVKAIDENIFKELELDTITGMSYKEFEDTKSALYNNSIYGTYEEMEYEDEENGNYNLKQKYGKSYTDLKKGYTLTTIDSDVSFHVIGKVTSAEAPDTILVPIKISSSYNMFFNIDLKVIDTKHYEEALKLFNEFKLNENYSFAYNMYSYNTGMITCITAIVKIVLIFLISIWLVGILSMINSVNTSILNRSKELMMLRSVGMTRKQLRRSVMLETIMFSATGAISGTILGVVIFIALLAIGGMLYLTKLSVIVPVVIASLTLNIIISLISAIPAVRTLGKVESIAQASNE